MNPNLATSNSTLHEPLYQAPRRPRRGQFRTSLLAHGEPMVWLCGGALAISLVMIVGLLLLVVLMGAGTFWPTPGVEIRTQDGKVYLGEPTRSEDYRPAAAVFQALPPAVADQARAFVDKSEGVSRRRLIRTGNFELTGSHFHWVSDFEVQEETLPDWVVVAERVVWGRFYGTPIAFLIDGQEVANEPAAVWAKFIEFHAPVRQRFHRQVQLEKKDLGDVNRKQNQARLDVRQAELDHGPDSPQYAAAQQKAAEVERLAEGETARISEEVRRLKQENGRYQMRLATADGKDKVLALADVVRAYPANRLSFGDKLGIYASRWWEFVADDPREANTEGGVFPAIWGTVAMTLLMSLAVVPFGVLAALYMREYARSGPIVSIVRIAVNNLAGVPSIVFGVFGLGFFCYIVGANIDQLFFQANLPNPTYGKGGLLWASLTLALLTLPVVIVSTEEALAAVPSSMREGSYACGASKWQTIQRIVLPRALPGIMTGMILAMARGAGEVAPLMLVGAVKLAPDLPLDGIFPYLHPQRSFLHLGFHIFDLGFQSPDSEAARPMVYTTTLLLITLVALMNLAAVWLRSRLRRRFVANQF